MGAAFSLWQPHGFTGWKFPPRFVGAPHHMLLACNRPDRARDFSYQLTGTALEAAAFIKTRGPIATPQWELSVGVDDVDGVISRVQVGGQIPTTWIRETDHSALRLHSPEGLSLQVHSLGQ